MRWLACVALGGCNLLFGATSDGGKTDDVDAAPSPDAPPTVELGVSIAIEHPVFADAGQAVLVMLKTTGDRGITYRLDADAGTFLANGGLQTDGTAAAGDQVTAIMWQPPRSFHRVHFEATALYEGDPGNPVSDVVDLDVYDHAGRFVITLPMARAVPANRMFAIPFRLDEPGHVGGLGIQVAAGNASVKLGLYSNQGGIPQTLLAQTPSLSINAGGRIEADVAGPNLGPGVYWVGVIADQPISVVGGGENENPAMTSGDGVYATGPSNPWRTPASESGTLGLYAILGPLQAPP
ncbi:MAG: hypothetical protein KIT31_24120 [Deltaproteobacteria bacterium]|nr:hypothetical protein [Deltaproteobacteria bacterium]